MNTLTRRFAGLALIVLSLSPLHRLLSGRETGLFGSLIVEVGSRNLELTWWGGLSIASVAVLSTLLFGGRAVVERIRRIDDALSALPRTGFVVLVGGLAFGFTLAVGEMVFSGMPRLIDELVQLAHARYLAAGRLAGIAPDPSAAWMISHTVLVAEGWVSQYPPLHPVLLALAFRVGGVSLIGPVLTGFTVAGATAVLLRLLPERPEVARAAGLVLAVSPLVLVLGSGYMSHVSAAAFLVLCVYAALRARDGSAGWAIVAGAAMGAAVASRPWTGLVLGGALSFGLWAVSTDGRGAGWLLSRWGAAVLGGVPFAAGLLLYNRHFFGSPWTLGYSVVWGGSHNLGFHPDPWGNVYGPVEAVGFTSAELVALGLRLLETPLSAVVVVGLYLLLARRIPKGAGVLTLWIVLPLLANALYWHHGMFLGPRMLYEAVPAWAALVVLSVIELVRPGGAGLGGGDAEVPPRRPAELLRPGGLRRILLWAVLLSLGTSALLLAPNRMRAVRWEPETLSRITAPDVPSGPAVVFVHTSWTERVGARLQGAGLPLDSLESALRRNPLCRVHRYAEARLSGRGGRTSLDWRPLPGEPPELRPIRVTPGNRILVDPSRELPSECRRELRADRFGIVSLAPLLWQGDLPGIEEGRPLFVRDLGPDDNRAVLARYPDRVPYLFFKPDPAEPPRLAPYEAGIELLWGTAGETRARQGLPGPASSVERPGAAGPVRTR